MLGWKKAWKRGKSDGKKIRKKGPEKTKINRQ